MARIWATTLRGRVTLIAAAVATLVLVPAGVAGAALARSLSAAEVWTENRDTAALVTGMIRGGDLAGDVLRLKNTDPTTLVQVVTADGTVVAATPAAQRLSRLSDVWPAASDRVVNTTACPSFGCLHLTALRESTRPDSLVVYVAQPTPSILAGRAVDLVIAIQVVLLTALITWIAWLLAGRTLRPVNQIRAQLDDINATDPGRRVVEPSGEDEIAKLARSINGTLARLEYAAEQQRRFASDASHELRTPLAGLRAQLEGAQLYPEDTDIAELVDDALKDTDRVEAIITDLLLLARIGSRVDIVKERLDLGELVRKTLLDRTGPVPITATLADGVFVEGVRFQLDRLLANLLDNAERHADTSIGVELTAAGDEAVLSLENDGAPIPEHERERIFERFTRLDSARSRGAGGTGLGLAIAREVAVAHRGSLRVAGDARFELRLPLAPPLPS
ncbi:ATP-binding protein [Nonomuraea sp. NPDC050310]|uniref:sensor histidine kinase n=1 Tax=unclassified Nonomuraea TaxID=2593643 RepID=UPI0033C5E82D